MAKSMKPGGGGRFASFVGKLEDKGEPAGEAKAVAANAGRAKYGKAKMEAWAKKGKKRAAK